MSKKTNDHAHIKAINNILANSYEKTELSIAVKEWDKVKKKDGKYCGVCGTSLCKTLLVLFNPHQKSFLECGKNCYEKHFVKGRIDGKTDKTKEDISDLEKRKKVKEAILNSNNVVSPHLSADEMNTEFYDDMTFENTTSIFQELSVNIKNDMEANDISRLELTMFNLLYWYKHFPSLFQPLHQLLSQFLNEHYQDEFEKERLEIERKRIEEETMYIKKVKEDKMRWRNHELYSLQYNTNLPIITGNKELVENHTRWLQGGIKLPRGDGKCKMISLDEIVAIKHKIQYLEGHKINVFADFRCYVEFKTIEKSNTHILKFQNQIGNSLTTYYIYDLVSQNCLPTGKYQF
jgi:hypothetical protein